MIATSPQDLWSLHRAGFYVCDPTNLTLDAAGRAVMGAGISRVVRERWPGAPERLGRWISTYSAPGVKPGQAARPDECTGRLVFLDRGARLVYLPTKYHWRERADLALIERGLGELAALLRAHPDLRVALPRLGSGLGGLDWEGEVRPLLTVALDHPDISPRVVLATPRRD
jgi:hypothetical protein